MRTATYGAACSLDGFIAGLDGSLDWLHFSLDVQRIMGDYWKTIDTILMGRKTWEVSAAAGGTGASGPGGIKTYLFSRTLRESPHPNVQLVSGQAAEFVRDLKGRKGKGICVMGGGELAQSLFQDDAIDEVGLNIHPILLGAGVPLFRDPGRRVPLTLLESRILDGGCVFALYAVRRGREKVNGKR
jgi:dihydrofolate reductase